MDTHETDRQGQRDTLAANPELALLRHELLDAFDEAARQSAGDPEQVGSVLGRLLTDLGLVNPDPELGERVDGVGPGRHGASQRDRVPVSLGRPEARGRAGWGR